MSDQQPEPEKPRTHAVNVRPYTYRMITEAAVQRGISRSLLVRLAVESYTARGPKKETRNDG